MTVAHHHRRSTFIDPRSLVFWVGMGLVVFGVIQVMPLITKIISEEPAVFGLSTLLWGVYAVVFSAITYRLELFQRRSPITMFGAFVWGAVVVTGVAIAGGDQIHDIVGKLLGPDQQDWVPAIAAPLVEEPLKMLGVIALAFIPAVKINSALDGLYYGLFVGLGFQVMENILYGAHAGSAADSALAGVVASFVLRGVVGGLWSHPTYSGITGAGVGYFFGSGAPAAKRWLVILGSLLLAMALHGLFDSPLVEVDNPVIATVVKGIPALVLLLVLLRIARKRERAVFEGIGETHVPTELVSSEELETLLTKRDRRKARKAMRKTHGFAASHALGRLQRSQIEMIAAVSDEGAGSENALAYADDVRDGRRVLQDEIT